MEAERDQRDLAGSGELRREDQWPAEPLGQTFEPAGEVDRRADRGEIQPVGSPDVAENDLAEMEADADPDLRPPGGAALPVEPGEAGISGDRRRIGLAVKSAVFSTP